MATVKCGQTGRHLQIHDRRVKRWRHLDLGSSRCVIECELRRLRCPTCGVRLEPVPWARPGLTVRSFAAARLRSSNNQNHQQLEPVSRTLSG